MKNLFPIILISILLSAACSDSSSSSSSTKGFILNPETLTVDDKYNSPDVQFDIDFDGTKTVNYAVVFTGGISDTDYVGIAMSDNPSSEAFNVKIYFQSSAFPATAYTINSTNSTIKVYYNNATYIWKDGESLTVNPHTATEITTDNEKSYTTYSFTITETATLVNSANAVDEIDITFTEQITAIYTGTDDSSSRK